MVAEVGAGPVKDDFGVRLTFTKNLGEFLDAQIFPIEEPEGGKLVRFQLRADGLPQLDGICGRI